MYEWHHRLVPEYPIRTERLLLRPLTVADTDGLLAYRSRPEIYPYVPGEPWDAAKVADRLATVFSNTDLTDEGQALGLGVETRETGDLVGDVVLFHRSREHLTGELGYVFNPDFGGRGYATEAAHAMLGLGFREFGLHRIMARIDERNTASANVARRLGMRREARLVENEFFKGEWTNELQFAMLAREWS
ncbi:GNAT family N-acetyltransferase [Actinoplanes missouriensis]